MGNAGGAPCARVRLRSLASGERRAESEGAEGEEGRTTTATPLARVALRLSPRPRPVGAAPSALRVRASQSRLGTPGASEATQSAETFEI